MPGWCELSDLGPHHSARVHARRPRHSLPRTPAGPSAARAPLTSYAVTDPRQDPRPGPARPDYPPAERLDLVEQLQGFEVADPYRWLEDPADPRTEAWSQAEDELARATLDALPGRDRLTARLTELQRTGTVRAPSWRGARAFYTRREPEQEHEALLVREADGTER